MGKPYSEDLRARVVRAAQDGATIPETVEQLRVSISSVVRFRRLHRETGSVSPAKFGGYKGYALAAHEALVRQVVAEQPDITLAEIKAVLATEKVTVGRLLRDNQKSTFSDNQPMHLMVEHASPSAAPVKPKPPEAVA
jgi:transposase